MERPSELMMPVVSVRSSLNGCQRQILSHLKPLDVPRESGKGESFGASI
jgi:hypothetical protein